ncbi:hypothetical protein PHYPSEUDO_000170 [Phytophthora pseudosyringae]|uniref:Uncharacterized protein n=1 Tax=Phytophthora pseudosyringae TaxID=221518 RepID=A0A8T1WEC7_9STRA|nr:hypothetical protein PHYPSEUDO_000170 [Phytophthora pseudosyringae]
MQATLAGAFFRRDTSRDGDDAPSAWQCPICSTSNEAVVGDLSPDCKTCLRSRYPQWLRLEDSTLQIVLGSRVFHTSVGGSTAVSIVVAINYAQKVVTLLRVKAKRSDRQGDVSFHEVVLNASQMQQQLGPLDAELEEDCVVDDYGVCGECRGVFRVAQGDPQSQFAHEDRVCELQKEVQQLGEQKLRLAREKAFEKVIECTQQVKLKEKQLQVAKRELEFLSPVFCPFCGWLNAPPPQ